MLTDTNPNTASHIAPTGSHSGLSVSPAASGPSAGASAASMFGKAALGPASDAPPDGTSRHASRRADDTVEISANINSVKQSASRPSKPVAHRSSHARTAQPRISEQQTSALAGALGENEMAELRAVEKSKAAAILAGKAAVWRDPRLQAHVKVPHAARFRPARSSDAANYGIGWAGNEPGGILSLLA